MSNELAVTYEVEGNELTVTADDVRNYISTSPNVTDKEVWAFINLCASQHLDPRRKDAHLIKYGTSPATMVVGKDVFTRRAQKNPRFKGFQAGITFINNTGALQRRKGSMLLPGEQLMGGWCKVFVEGYEEPMEEEVSFAEYVGLKKDGSVNQQWSTKPATMIRKVAIVHGLREAFPDDLGGLYDESEMGNVDIPAAAPEPVVDRVQEPVQVTVAPHSWEEMMGIPELLFESDEPEEQGVSALEATYEIAEGMEEF